MGALGFGFATKMPNFTKRLVKLEARATKGQPMGSLPFSGWDKGWVTHDRLINKLDKLGYHVSIHKVLASYQRNRQDRVRARQTHSKYREGALLSRLLVTIYTAYAEKIKHYTVTVCRRHSTRDSILVCVDCEIIRLQASAKVREMVNSNKWS